MEAIKTFLNSTEVVTDEKGIDELFIPGNTLTCHNVTELKTYGISNNSYVEVVSFPNCNSYGYSSFYNCSELRKIIINGSTINSPIAVNCPKLNEIIFIDCTVRPNSVCNINAETIKLQGNNMSIYEGAFMSSGLKELYLLSNKMLFNYYYSAYFNNTPLANGNGHIYVPAHLYETYVNSEYVATYADLIVAV